MVDADGLRRHADFQRLPIAEDGVSVHRSGRLVADLEVEFSKVEYAFPLIARIRSRGRRPAASMSPNTSATTLGPELNMDLHPKSGLSRQRTMFTV